MKTILTIILVIVSATALAREFTQTGNSMSPTIEHGESIKVGVLSSFYYKPKRWEIVIFSNPSGEFNALIGRIVGMPNEKIFINEEGLHINGKIMPLPQKMRNAGIRYLPPNKTMVGDRFKNREYRTKEDEYFILGDNSYTARDSRFFGSIHRDQIANKIESQ